MSSDHLRAKSQPPPGQRSRTSWRSFAGLGAIVLAVAACTTSGVVDTDDLVRLIEVDLADQLGVQITDIECPTVTDPDVGDTTTCTGTIDEQTSEFTITFTDIEDLTASVTNADAIFVRDDLTNIVIDEFAAAGATALDVDCFGADTPGTQYLIAAPDSVIDCDVVLDDGEELLVQINVIDNTGVIELSIAP